MLAQRKELHLCGEQKENLLTSIGNILQNTEIKLSGWKVVASFKSPVLKIG